MEKKNRKIIFDDLSENFKTIIDLKEEAIKQLKSKLETKKNAFQMINTFFALKENILLECAQSIKSKEEKV